MSTDSAPHEGAASPDGGLPAAVSTGRFWLKPLIVATLLLAAWGFLSFLMPVRLLVLALLLFSLRSHLRRRHDEQRTRTVAVVVLYSLLTFSVAGFELYVWMDNSKNPAVLFERMMNSLEEVPSLPANSDLPTKPPAPE